MRMSYYAPEKSDRHHRMILNTLEGLCKSLVAKKSTDTVIASNCWKSPTFHDYLVYRYVSEFADGSEEELCLIMQHLKHKSIIVLFHVVDNKTELNFDLIMLQKVYWCRNRRRNSCFAETVQQEYKNDWINILKKAVHDLLTKQR
jgi:hypothetical protein